MSEQSITEILATWMTRQRRVGFPQSLLERTKDYVLDWLGSAMAGTASLPGKTLLEYGRAQPPGPCTLIGGATARSSEVAAFVNGGLSHIVEMDDLDRKSVLHPGAVVIPASFALAERVGASGTDFLTAVAVGYEVAIRVGEAVGKKHYQYFHNTATCGTFGSAAACAWLLGLNKEQIVSALGNAGTQASGLWEFNTDGAMSKHLHTGRAAASGLLAADLAALGFTGTRRILEGSRGFFAGMAPDAEPGVVSAGMDGGLSNFKICGVSIKPHASCRHTHPAVDVALKLGERVDGNDLERIEIDTYSAALALCDNGSPRTAYEAKFSLQYCVASALLRGHVGLRDFTQEAVQEPAVRKLLPLIRPSLCPEFEALYPSQWPARLRVFMNNKEALTATVYHPRGDPENAMSSAELKDKFRMLVSQAVAAPPADELITWVSGLAKDRRVVYPW